MDKKTLKQYPALKKEIGIIDEKLDKLYDRSSNVPVVMGKVKGSSEDFPFTEVRTSVQMQEPEEKARIRALIWLKKQRKEKGQKLLVSIEQFIAEIPDSETRIIFELSFQDGMSQKEVGERLSIDRSYVSKKIDDYLNFHTIHRNSVV